MKNNFVTFSTIPIAGNLFFALIKNETAFHARLCLSLLFWNPIKNLHFITSSSKISKIVLKSLN